MSKKKFVRAGKNEFRKLLQNASAQIQDMALTIAILLDREGGATTLTREEIDNVNQKRRIDVKIDEAQNVTLRMVNNDEVSEGQRGETPEESSGPVNPATGQPLSEGDSGTPAGKPSIARI